VVGLVAELRPAVVMGKTTVLVAYEQDISQFRNVCWQHRMTVVLVDTVFDVVNEVSFPDSDDGCDSLSGSSEQG
jgi:hypothetical protein